jgi:hypothetical protein
LKSLQHLTPEWMDLKSLRTYACVSDRSVRDWIHRPQHPLPAVQVEKGKFLVKRSEFDKWLIAHTFQSVDSVDFDGIVNDVLKELRVN